MHCYVCGRDVDTSDVHGVVAFEVMYEGDTRGTRPKMLEWAHKRCEERERGIDLTYSDRHASDYLSGSERENWLDSEAEDAFERQQSSAMGGGSFLSPDATQRSLKRG